METDCIIAISTLWTIKILGPAVSWWPWDLLSTLWGTNKIDHAFGIQSLVHIQVVYTDHKLIREIISLPYPANKSRPDFKEKLEIKLSPSWIELMTHEKVIDNISCWEKVKSKKVIITATCPLLQCRLQCWCNQQ